VDGHWYCALIITSSRGEGKAKFQAFQGVIILEAQIAINRLLQNHLVCRRLEKVELS
jgi:hypothetical protein